MERVKDVEGTVGMDGLGVLEVDEVYLVSGAAALISISNKNKMA